LKNRTPEGGKVLKQSSGKGPYVLRTDNTAASREMIIRSTLTWRTAAAGHDVGDEKVYERLDRQIREALQRGSL
jgi:hypothetical protein